MTKYRLAIFASGSGTNTENLIREFRNSGEIEVSLVLTNRKTAYVIERARKLDVPYGIFNRSQLENNDSRHMINLLKKHQIDFIILAGFLMKVPAALISRFPEKIINIHPSLLPAYGGKGMYGQHVHEAVVAAGESRSGITIHLVNEEYDKGKVLFQASCPVDPGDSAEDLAAKVHALEYQHFGEVIKEYILNGR